MSLAEPKSGFKVNELGQRSLDAMDRAALNGWTELREPPRVRSGGGSYEICPSCGFEFGVSDDDAGHCYAAWRRRWLAAGAKWAGRGRKPPPGWDPHAQLAVLTPRKGPRANR